MDPPFPRTAEEQPTQRTVQLLGSGRVELAAYGPADAEHRAETDWDRLWPGTAFHVTGVSRAESEPRIVEHFVVTYRVRVGVAVDASDSAAALRAAYRLARERVGGSRFQQIQWSPAPAVAANSSC